jgi:hypothetical protein
LQTEKIFHNLNPFYIQKKLDSITRKSKSASCLGNGTLLVEVKKKLLGKLLKTILLKSYSIIAERHASLNFCRGVVRTNMFIIC